MERQSGARVGQLLSDFQDDTTDVLDDTPMLPDDIVDVVSILTQYIKDSYPAFDEVINFSDSDNPAYPIHFTSMSRFTKSYSIVESILPSQFVGSFYGTRTTLVGLVEKFIAELSFCSGRSTRQYNYMFTLLFAIDRMILRRIHNQDFFDVESMQNMLTFRQKVVDAISLPDDYDACDRFQKAVSEKYPGQPHLLYAIYEFCDPFKKYMKERYDIAASLKNTSLGTLSSGRYDLAEGALIALPFSKEEDYECITSMIQYVTGIHFTDSDKTLLRSVFERLRRADHKYYPNLKEVKYAYMKNGVDIAKLNPLNWINSLKRVSEASISP